MIKVFIANEAGKIELTKEELEAALNEAYQNGYNDAKQPEYIHSPRNWWDRVTITPNPDTVTHPLRDVVTIATTGEYEGVV